MPDDLDSMVKEISSGENGQCVALGLGGDAFPDLPLWFSETGDIVETAG